MTTNVWRAADLEGIRVALSIPARMAAIRAINDAMADLEQDYPDAIAGARARIDAIGAIDAQLDGLTPEQLQTPIRSISKGPVSPLPAGVTLPPISKADVIEFDTELLRAETTLYYEKGLSTAAALQRLRANHARALLLILPQLADWSRDPLLSSQSISGPFTAAVERG